MKKPTYEEIWEACIRLMPSAAIMRSNDVDLPRVCRMVAEKCFMEQTPEDENTQLLREQLKALHGKGQFDFREE